MRLQQETPPDDSQVRGQPGTGSHFLIAYNILKSARASAPRPVAAHATPANPSRWRSITRARTEAETLRRGKSVTMDVNHLDLVL
mgnify:CR=1 FL=1